MAKRGKARETQELDKRVRDLEFNQHQLVTQQQFSGTIERRTYHMDLPNPDDIAKLEALKQGSFDIILEQYQKQGNHRIEIEKKVIGGNVFAQKASIFVGGFLVFAALICGTYLIAIGKDASGLAAIIGAMAVPLGIFIGNKIFQHKDLKEKNKNS
jgi:uncharacterized membrane protein